MMITKKYLPRRTVLRGLGATLALPLLDSMVPALTALRASAAAPVRRFGAVYLGMGMNMPLYQQPGGNGPIQVTPAIEPIASFKDRLTIISGLDMKNADTSSDGTGQHSRIGAAWLTGLRPKKTEGIDLQAGVSLDQLIARELGKETQLASLELALEAPDFLGSCEFGYTCAYTSTLAWRTPKTPLPMEINPRAVFERLFGVGDTTDAKARVAQISRNRSLLDSVTGDISRLERKVGASDRAKLIEYTDAVRDVEHRIQKAEEQSGHELPTVEKPTGIPATFEGHAKLLFDLLVLAYQIDMTRVATFMLVRELSLRTYPEIGVPDPHHPLSHHLNNPEKLAKQAKLNVFHMKLFAHFLDKMAATPDGEGSLLDHTLILFGSGMSDSNLHLPRNVPTIVVGGKTFGIKGDQHIKVVDQTPLTNLQVTLMNKMGVRADRFGDSNGTTELVSA
jgi:hypothetical protein